MRQGRSRSSEGPRTGQGLQPACTTLPELAGFLALGTRPAAPRIIKASLWGQLGLPPAPAGPTAVPGSTWDVSTVDAGPCVRFSAAAGLCPGREGSRRHTDGLAGISSGRGNIFLLYASFKKKKGLQQTQNISNDLKEPLFPVAVVVFSFTRSFYLRLSNVGRRRTVIKAEKQNPLEESIRASV